VLRRASSLRRLALVASKEGAPPGPPASAAKAAEQTPPCLIARVCEALGGSDDGGAVAVAAAPGGLGGGGGGGGGGENAPLQALSIHGYEAFASTDGYSILRLMQLGRRFATLRTLSLQATPISADALCSVIATLVCDRDRRRPPLSLDASRNPHLGKLGGLKLASLLTEGAPLAALRMASCALGAEGVRALAEALTGVATLTALDLSSNISTPPKIAPSAASASSSSSASDVKAKVKRLTSSDVVNPSSDGSGDAANSGGAGGAAGAAAALAKTPEAVAVAAACGAVAALLTHAGCRLQTLHFSGGRGRGLPSQLAPLLRALASSATVVEADLSCHGGGAAVEAADALRALLASGGRFRRLQLHSNGFALATLKAAVDAVEESNLGLTQLTLVWPSAGTAAAEVRAASMRRRRPRLRAAVLAAAVAAAVAGVARAAAAAARRRRTWRS